MESKFVNGKTSTKKEIERYGDTRPVELDNQGENQGGNENKNSEDEYSGYAVSRKMLILKTTMRGHARPTLVESAVGTPGTRRRVH